MISGTRSVRYERTMKECQGYRRGWSRFCRRRGQCQHGYGAPSKRRARRGDYKLESKGLQIYRIYDGTSAVRKLDLDFSGSSALLSSTMRTSHWLVSDIYDLDRFTNAWFDPITGDDKRWSTSRWCEVFCGASLLEQSSHRLIVTQFNSGSDQSEPLETLIRSPACTFEREASSKGRTK